MIIVRYNGLILRCDIVKRRDDYILKRTGGSDVIVPVGRAALEFPGMVRVNATGALIWELLSEDVSEEQLVQAILERYDAPEGVVKADVASFLGDLRRAGAVTE